MNAFQEYYQRTDSEMRRSVCSVCILRGGMTVVNQKNHMGLCFLNFLVGTAPKCYHYIFFSNLEFLKYIVPGP